MAFRACSQSFIVLLSAHKQAHAALKMRAKACFGCAFCLACTRFCTKIRYKKDREQALRKSRAKSQPTHLNIIYSNQLSALQIRQRHAMPSWQRATPTRCVPYRD